MHIERTVLSVFLCIVGLLPINHLAADQLYIDKGACPGEYCNYGESIIAQQDFKIFRSPSRRSETVGALSKGESFIAKTMEVHTLPQRGYIFKKFGNFLPGDDLDILTYESEGYYLARHNGKLISFELGFYPWGESSGESSPYWDTCDEDDEDCSFNLSGPIQSVWWIYALSEKGNEGWIKYRDSFILDEN